MLEGGDQGRTFDVGVDLPIEQRRRHVTDLTIGVAERHGIVARESHAVAAIGVAAPGVANSR